MFVCCHDYFIITDDSNNVTDIVISSLRGERQGVILDVVVNSDKIPVASVMPSAAKACCLVISILAMFFQKAPGPCCSMLLL